MNPEKRHIVINEDDSPIGTLRIILELGDGGFGLELSAQVKGSNYVWHDFAYLWTAESVIAEDQIEVLKNMLLEGKIN